ncbi:MAG: acylneuraminate cytidylyltransferase family protein [Bacteroidetes bacterium]|nr:acylneuraminate cytidylyltransferase family protein [Bacteroidota bacterium]
MNTKTIAFVPARCGSKSIPFKNIKLFCGRPLIFWVLSAMDEVADIDEVYVATDCDEIKSVVESFGLQKVKIYIRDPENSQDESSTESVMLEFVAKMDFKNENNFILVQATCPLVTEIDFRKAIQQFVQEKADSLLTCARMKIFLWGNNGMPLNYDFKNRPRRQEIKGELMENGAFYITSVGALTKYMNRLSGKISIYEMPEYTSIDIDDDYDWTVAEMLMKKYILGEGR